MAVVGVALRTLVWWPSHNLFGVLEYDDGVYYAAARLLLDSYLPYSDFSIVHPPGVSLVLLPAAVFGYLLGDTIGMVAGRVEMQLVVALNIVLVYRLAALLPGDRVTRSRRALVAAALYAVMQTPEELGRSPKFRLTILGPAIRRLYRPEARFGKVEVWARRGPAEATLAVAETGSPLD